MELASFSSRRPPKPPFRVPSRPWVVFSILAIAALGMAGRLLFLQVLSGENYRDRAKALHSIQRRLLVPRVPIVDRNHVVLAHDQKVFNLYGYPNQIPLASKPEAANQLAAILGQPAEQILAKLTQKTTFVTLADRIPEVLSNQIAKLIRQNKYPGLELVARQHRYYPQKQAVAEVLGFVNDQDQGGAGVELVYDQKIARQEQNLKLIRDAYGNWLSQDFSQDMWSQDQTVLQLTIDLRIQAIARQALVRQLSRYGAKRGAVMVMDAANGELRAMVNEPTYDPNQFFKYSKELHRNWAVTDLFEPGSTFKPINVAIALENQSISLDSSFYDQGKLTISNEPVANFDYDATGPVGVLTLSQILQRSSNVGMVHIIRTMKPQVYYDWLERLGLGESSKIDLPGERASQLRDQEQFVTYDIESATAAFGQGLSMSPVQLLQIHGILASGGKLLTPHVTRGLVDQAGKLIPAESRPAPRQIFSPSTTAQVLSMMEDVVELGTGKVAKIPGYRFGGKTGTAQKSDQYGYTDKKATSFVGIFPTVKPRYVVLAVIDEPIGDDAFGSTVAAPIVKEVLEDLIVQDGIPPSHPQELKR
ncbi:MAG: penicillin-binding protein 2 [Pseudanabaenaceae cyanobacterium bins.68]|nr:penicillin-binding protein 2 [Pseudanabaenaceae cyanobacterium bins.68]